MSDIRTKSVKRFIRHELPEKIQKDLRLLRMVRESDLETSVYFHRRSFLAKDENWHVFARKHSKTTGHFVDLILFRRTTPRIAIELKWNQKKVHPKDHKSLKKAIRKLNVNHAYYISTIINGEDAFAEKPIKKSIQRNSILAIFIPPGFTDKEKYLKWRSNRKVFTSQMQKGIARHKVEKGNSK